MAPESTSSKKCGGRGVPPRIEATIRSTIASLAGFCLSVGAPVRIIPQSNAFLVGIVSSSFAVSFPQLMFAIGAAFPGVLTALIFGMVANSMILCAATVSDGLFCAVFSVYVLWISSLKYGPDRDKTIGFANVCIVIAALNALSFRTFVQDNGGLSAVAELWTQSGLDNPLANNRNFIIAFCWALACVAVGILLPPFRTARAVLSRGVVPMALGNASASIRSARGAAAEEKGAGEAEMKEEEEGDDEAEAQARLSRLVHLANGIGGGKPALLTAYEPRLCRAPFECTWPALRALLLSTSRLIMAAMTADSWRHGDAERAEEREAISEAADAINACAEALAAGDEGAAEALWERGTKAGAAAPEGGGGNADAVGGSPPRSFATGLLLSIRDGVLSSTADWIDAQVHPPKVAPCSKQFFKNAGRTYALWFVAPLPLLKRLAEAFTIPFRRGLWDLRSFVDACEWTLGFAVLCVMTVYWDGYANYGIDVDGGGVASLYHGWNMMTYGLCWSPTMEGTFKLSLMRTLGTALGGFWAWVGLIACSGSYEADAVPNPYGLVAWLTVFTAVAAYVAHDEGFAARMGMNQDHGQVGMFFAVTQALVMLQVEAGKGTRDDITVNRIIATASGCIMCCLVSVIPPYTRGGDARYARDMLKEVRATIPAALGLLTGGDEDRGAKLESAKKDFQCEFLARRRLAMLLYKDASKLRSLPFLKVDPRLNSAIEEISVIGAMGNYLLSLSQYILEKEELAVALSEDKDLRDEVAGAARKLGGVSAQSQKDEAVPEQPLRDDAEKGGDELVLFTDLLRDIVRRVDRAEASLSALE